jgi:hypothetical protein
MDIPALLDTLKTHGITVTVNGDRLKLVPGSRVPQGLADTLRAHKAEVMDYLLNHQACPSTPAEAHDPMECWPLKEWRRVSIPEWRRILQESIDKRDSKREAYARWMLRDILLDPEYQEPAP